MLNSKKSKAVIDRVARFKFLEAQYSRPHRGMKQSSVEWIAAHREMFELAQVICFAYEPELQHQLSRARLDVMRYLNRHEAPVFHTDAVMAVDKAGHLRWQDFQITPEVTFNLALKGHGVPKSLAEPLIKLHRQQVRAVMSITAAVV